MPGYVRIHTDEEGETYEVSESVTIQNGEPEITSISISPSSGVDTSTTLTCSAEGSDSSGDDPTIIFVRSSLFVASGGNEVTNLPPRITVIRSANRKASCNLWVIMMTH